MAPAVARPTLLGMSEVSEGFLLTIAQIAATLIGLLLVGALFYAETGLRQLGQAAPAAGPYFRSGTVSVLALYFLVLAISLALVAFEAGWVMPLFVVVGVAVVATLVSFTSHARVLSSVRPDLLHPVSAWLPWPPTVIGLALPWLLGGLTPAAADYVVSLLVLGSLGFLATAGLVVSTFELAAAEPSRDAE